MTETYRDCKSKADATGDHNWNSVCGPAAAMIATCQRLGWRSSDGKVFQDDVGGSLDITLDPPKAFSNAARRSVSRLLTDKMVASVPSAEPKGADVSFHSTFSAENARDGGRRFILVDLTSFLRPLYRGSKKIATRFPQWSACCRGYLTSAVSGGQWPQIRKTKLPNFEATDKCQLCHGAVGTLMHRHACPVTCPPQGWTEHTGEGRRFLGEISADRRYAATTRGVLTVKVPIPKPQVESLCWHWLTNRPDINDLRLTWVIDGSRRYASDWVLSTTGCGVAVLNQDGLLVAFATATPPAWVKTAGAAEAWALLLTLRENPAPPRILTDCMRLLTAAKSGTADATKGSRADARIWKLIDNITTDNFTQLRDALVWMPAHTTAAGASQRVKSDSKPLSTAEWRANNLADRLAKNGAASTQLTIAADAAIKAAGDALLQAAARLGTVTHAANNYKTIVVREDGTTVTHVARDSSAIPPCRAAAKFDRLQANASASATPAAAAARPRVRVVAPLAQLTIPQKKAQERRGHAASSASALAEQTANLVASAAAGASPPATSAAQRLAALRSRLGFGGTSSLAPLPPAAPPVAAVAATPEDSSWSFFGLGSS